MSLARVATRCRQGINASIVWVEAHLSPGLPTIAVVGVSATVVKDAKERVRSAIISSGYRWPMRQRRWTRVPWRSPHTP